MRRRADRSAPASSAPPMPRQAVAYASSPWSRTSSSRRRHSSIHGASYSRCGPRSAMRKAQRAGPQAGFQSPRATADSAAWTPASASSTPTLVFAGRASLTSPRPRRTSGPIVARSLETRTVSAAGGAAGMPRDQSASISSSHGNRYPGWLAARGISVRRQRRKLGRDDTADGDHGPREDVRTPRVRRPDQGRRCSPPPPSFSCGRRMERERSDDRHTSARKRGVPRRRRPGPKIGSSPHARAASGP
jgi:hypothetical protein